MLTQINKLIDVCLKKLRKSREMEKGYVLWGYCKHLLYKYMIFKMI